MYDQEFPAETTDARNRRKRDAQDWANLGDNPNEERAEEADIAAATRRARDQLTTLTSSKSFVLAMAHVCSLKQRIKYSNDVPPNSVEDWDRKTWSGENHFTSTGVAVDPGNFVLATMLLAIRHALGMEEHLSADGIMQAPDPKGGNRPAPWSSPPCSRHPVFTGSAAAGLARKEGYVQAIANLFRAGAPIAACLRIVIETLVQEEKPHQVSTHTRLPDNKCESLGDVLEAAGGLLSPYTPAAKKVMHSMHAAHGITAMDDADAFRSLSSLAQSIKDLTRMIPPPKAHDGSPGANRERIWAILNEVQPDDIAFESRARDAQGGCWICRELSHLGEHLLLNPNPEDGEWALEPNLREPRGNARRHNLGRPNNLGGTDHQSDRAADHQSRTVLKARRADHRSRDRGHAAIKIIVRSPPIIIDTRLHYTGNKGTYNCDDCEGRFHGPYHGEFTEAARDLDYEDIEAGWINGTVDATWFCVECWKDRLNMDTPSTRTALGLPPAATPAEILDQRFHQHAARWSVCDNCEVHCTGKARDYLPGSFAFAIDNTHAGPPKDRKTCFPNPMFREDKWLRGEWNATYLCRTCLVQEWQRPAWEIDEWLAMHRSAAQKPFSRWKGTERQPPPRDRHGGSQWHGKWQYWSASDDQYQSRGSQWHVSGWHGGWGSGDTRWR